MDSVRLHALAMALRQVAADASPDGGRGGAAAVVLRDIAIHGPTAVGEVARRTGVVQSQVSTVVARLREEGVVVAEPDPAGGRRVLLAVDPAGLKAAYVAGDVRDAVRERLAARGEVVTDEAVDAVVAQMDALAASLVEA